MSVCVLVYFSLRVCMSFSLCEYVYLCYVLYMHTIHNPIIMFSGIHQQISQTKQNYANFMLE